MPWKHVVAPTKGLVTNKPSTGIEEQASPYMSGVVLRDGEIRSDFGMSAFPTAGSYPNLPAWLKNTKARDIGCPLCCQWAMMSAVTVPWWTHFIAFMLLFGALTTYWDFIFMWDNHWFHGFMCGAAYFPYAIISGDWVGYGVRCIALAILMGLISTQSDSDVVEEVGRGAMLPLTLPLLFI